ncbi:MAG: NRDE family protein [Verrucomicrobiales bacterium]
MCSVTFIPRADGFLLGMNRDESRSRPVAVAPRIHHRAGHDSLHPSEPTGGTWIGVNDSGLCCALLNWYSNANDPTRSRTSRGGIIPALMATGTITEVRPVLATQRLRSMAPFRLVVVSSSERSLHEFRWNQKTLAGLHYPWKRHHWFSSGFDEHGAQRQRSRTAQKAAGAPDAGTLPWLRRLHASHDPVIGPFSICMHRPDAATVSYTEVVATSQYATMRYHDGPLCCAPTPKTTHELSLQTKCKESARNPTNLPAGYSYENQQPPFQSSRRSLLPRGVSSCRESDAIAR